MIHARVSARRYKMQPHVVAIRTLFVWGESVQVLMGKFNLTESAIQKTVQDLRSEHEKWGCTREQYRLLVKNGARDKFYEQKYTAGKRGIGWELSLWQWWTIWRESGHWAKRGGGQGYVMCRKGDTGPYAVGNVFIATGRQNCSEGNKIRTHLPIGVMKAQRCKDRYMAHRSINGDRRYLGTFSTPEEAHAAYLAFGEEKLS